MQSGLFQYPCFPAYIEAQKLQAQISGKFLLRRDFWNEQKYCTSQSAIPFEYCSPLVGGTRRRGCDRLPEKRPSAAVKASSNHHGRLRFNSRLAEVRKFWVRKKLLKIAKWSYSLKDICVQSCLTFKELSRWVYFSNQVQCSSLTSHASVREMGILNCGWVLTRLTFIWTLLYSYKSVFAWSALDSSLCWHREMTSLIFPREFLLHTLCCQIRTVRSLLGLVVSYPHGFLFGWIFYILPPWFLLGLWFFESAWWCFY